MNKMVSHILDILSYLIKEMRTDMITNENINNRIDYRVILRDEFSQMKYRLDRSDQFKYLLKEIEDVLSKPSDFNNDYIDLDRIYHKYKDHTI